MDARLLFLQLVSVHDLRLKRFFKMIRQLIPEYSLWDSMVALMKKHKDSHEVLDEDDQPKPGVHFLVAVEDDNVVGYITIKLQYIVIPATERSGGEEKPLTYANGTHLKETFVQTFAVAEEYRRQGHGRDLQIEALNLTRGLGAYQMRSWSSSDKDANYALKLHLGFSVHPAIDEPKPGLKISGVYFVKTV
jgi:GNAT superfamily N-acetyltransferase